MLKNKSSLLIALLILSGIHLIPSTSLAKNKLGETLTAPNKKLLTYHFKVPESLKAQVDFWKTVYSKYDKGTVLIHDTADLGIIYGKVDVSKIITDESLDTETKKSLRSQKIDDEVTRIRNILLGLQAVDDGTRSLSTLDSEEKRIYDFLKNRQETDRFKLAASSERLRTQTCMKEKFINAIKTSGRFLPQFEEIFNSYGVPQQVSRLVFVESMFNLKARSKVGASGLWQFMPDTGRIYNLNVGSLVDERNDPILAAHAAARLLKSNYDALGTWPLAINAYNSGRGTMSNAVKATGSKDIATIINNYRGGVYGFASRNFYPCFLAVLDVAENYYSHFGSIAKDSPVLSEQFFLTNEANLSTIANLTGLSLNILSELNPAYDEAVLNGEKTIPKNYRINIPKGENALFAKAMQQISSTMLAENDETKAVIQNTSAKKKPIH